MSKLPLIIEREFIARVRNRTFVIMTFVSPLVIVGAIAVISWLSQVNKDETKKIAIVDETGLFAKDFDVINGITFVDYSAVPIEIAKDTVISNELYGLLYVPKKSNAKNIANSIQLFADESPDFRTLRSIEKVFEEKLTEQNYKDFQLDISAINQAKTEVDIQIQDFSGEKTSKIANLVKMAFGGIAGYLLLMFVVIYGNMVMRSVIEEKTNRIIEIIISSVKPFQLLLGKIIGTTLAGISQFIIWVIIGGLLLVGIQYFLGIEAQPDTLEQVSEIANQTGEGQQEKIKLIVQDILKLPLVALVVLFFLYFIGGYFLYSAIYAAIGAAVDSETDSQQFMPIVVVPLVLSFYVGAFSVVENPHGIVSNIFSYIPLTSPIVMLMRVPFGVSWWEVTLSLSILVLSIIGVVWLAAKIYRVGILMYGKKPSYKELAKWLKY
ncbi:ABC transporter permease [Aquimarina sp. ERC-38]|uniref:ABC transporter permease n=1 Tax=Aquimarina sp. ERC-38 TaxID=2949996 RepID=UPI0022473281|nr:ABC transporter permease [Aquimarina sp. ERC-38]UZO80910.1 ABC transporter permease [Aquimarina sp. ERC-38]